MCVHKWLCAVFTKQYVPNTLAAQSIGHREDHGFESRLGNGHMPSFSLYLFSVCRQALRRADPP
jgi:hypothetical protein